MIRSQRQVTLKMLKAKLRLDGSTQPKCKSTSTNTNNNNNSHQIIKYNLFNRMIILHPTTKSKRFKTRLCNNIVRDVHRCKCLLSSSSCSKIQAPQINAICQCNINTANNSSSKMQELLVCNSYLRRRKTWNGLRVTLTMKKLSCSSWTIQTINLKISQPKSSWNLHINLRKEEHSITRIW